MPMLKTKSTKEKANLNQESESRDPPYVYIRHPWWRLILVCICTLAFIFGLIFIFRPGAYKLSQELGIGMASLSVPIIAEEFSKASEKADHTFQLKTENRERKKEVKGLEDKLDEAGTRAKDLEKALGEANEKIEKLLLPNLIKLKDAYIVGFQFASSFIFSKEDSRNSIKTCLHYAKALGVSEIVGEMLRENLNEVVLLEDKRTRATRIGTAIFEAYGQDIANGFFMGWDLALAWSFPDKIPPSEFETVKKLTSEELKRFLNVAMSSSRIKDNVQKQVSLFDQDKAKNRIIFDFVRILTLYFSNLVVKNEEMEKLVTFLENCNIADSNFRQLAEDLYDEILLNVPKEEI